MRNEYNIVAASLLGSFLIVFGLMHFGYLARLDEAILLLPRQYGDTSALRVGARLSQSITDFTALGGLTVLFFLTAATAGFFILNGKLRLSAVLIGTVLSGFLVSASLKILVGRARPEIVPHLIPVHDASFPSGHAMVSAVVYMTMALLLAAVCSKRIAKFYVISVALFLILAIGASRIFLGVHFPSDVLAGWLLGLAWAFFCVGISRKYVLK